MHDFLKTYMKITIFLFSSTLLENFITVKIKLEYTNTSKHLHDVNRR